MNALGKRLSKLESQTDQGQIFPPYFFPCAEDVDEMDAADPIKWAVCVGLEEPKILRMKNESRGSKPPFAAGHTKVRYGPKAPVGLISAKDRFVRIADVQAVRERRDAANDGFEPDADIRFKRSIR